MKKISVLFIALTALLFSCSKEEQGNLDEMNYQYENQRVFINNIEYNLTAKIEEKGDFFAYENQPQEVSQFFEEFGETFVPYMTVKDGKETTIYYKNHEDFLANVKFHDMPESQPKGQNQAQMDC
jgi:hypothetical protein